MANLREWVADGVTLVTGSGSARSCGSPPSATEPVDRIERDIELIRELGGTGTPSVAVNGTLFGTRPDSARLEEMLEGILAQRAN